MGMSKLNVYISETDDPCKISKRTWYVTIFNCDGTVLEHCDRRFLLIPARCGHVEIPVPPGCYYIKAVWGFVQVGPGIFRVNHFTDAAIVTLCCHDEVCVRLFNPSVHRCGFIYAKALQDLARQGVIEANLANRVERIVDEVAERDEGRPALRFEVPLHDEIEARLKEIIRAEQKPLKKPKKSGDA